MKIFNHTIYAPTKIERHDKTSALSVPSVVDTYQYGYRVNIYSGSESAWTLDKEITFTYDGWNLIQEQTMSGFDISLTNSAFTQFRTSNYTWGLDLSQTIQGAGGVSGLLSLDKGTATYYYTYDANGNVSELIDTAGVVKAHYEYSPFGKVVHKSGPLADKNAFQFSTKYLDNETQLYYYGLRYYNPESGRWINRDPITETGGINIYAFCFNNSLNKYDPYGLSTVDDIAVPTGYVEVGWFSFDNLNNKYDGEDSVQDKTKWEYIKLDETEYHYNTKISVEESTWSSEKLNVEISGDYGGSASAEYEVGRSTTHLSIGKKDVDTKYKLEVKSHKTTIYKRNFLVIAKCCADYFDVMGQKPPKGFSNILAIGKNTNSVKKLYKWAVNACKAVDNSKRTPAVFISDDWVQGDEIGSDWTPIPGDTDPAKYKVSGRTTTHATAAGIHKLMKKKHNTSVDQFLGIQ